MKLSICFLIFLGAVALQGATLLGYVVATTDGDTVRVLDAEKKQHRVRLWGIDAPESHQAFGARSKELLSRLIHNKNVRIEYESKDMYGRILGTIFLGEQNINLEMVKQGLAWHYVYYAKDNKELAEAQKQAQQQKLGLWQDPNPIPPWNFRRERKKAKK